METIAQEAKRLLEPIPENKWLVGLYGTHSINGAHCFVGHWNKLHSGQAGYSEEEKSLNETVKKFLKSRRYDAFEVNDGLCKKYQQDTPKARVMALLDDMIAAGY